MKTGLEYLIAHQDDFDQVSSSDKEALFYADREKARNFYLRQKPACFIVIGKPSTGKTSVAKMLVKEMRCQYIHATHLIEKNVSEDTSIGKYFKEKLLSGKNLSLQEMATLLKEATSLPECYHYGYVMDGFPSYLALEEQLQLVENIPMKPDYVVHIEIPDEDLEKRLESQRMDPVNGSIYNFLNFKDPPGPFLKPTSSKSSKKQKRDDDDLNLADEQEERSKLNKLVSWHPDFPRLSKEVMERLLIRPEDTKRELVKLFELNADVVPKSLDIFFKHFPKSHVIRIDGNCPPSQMFHNLMVKVRSLPLGPAIPPFPLSLKMEGEEEQEETIGEEDETLLVENESTGDVDTNDDVDIDWDEVIASLSVTKMPTEHSRWHLSEWQYFCPVQLYNGILEHGKVRFACGFLGFLFFLSSREAMDSFTRNPRPYLDYYGQFRPKPTVRIAILGFQESGATSLCHLISEKCGAKLISLSEILKAEIEAKEKGILEKIKIEVETDLIDKLTKQRKRELDEIFTNSIADNAMDEIMVSTINKLTIESLKEFVRYESEHREAREEEAYTEADNEGEPPIQRLKKSITEQHPQVVEAVDRALAFARAQPCYLEPNRYVEALVAELERLEEENANIAPENRRPLNWVIEGLPPLEEVWQLVKERSQQIHKQVNLTRHAHESLHKIRHLLQQLKKHSASSKEEEVEEEVEERVEEEEEDDENLEEEEEEQSYLQQTKESCNSWAEQPDPRLVKAQKRFEEAASQNISPDPMPTHIFKLKDELGDRALMIHRLYKIGYGPFEGLESIPSVEGYDIPAVENMMNTKPSRTDHSRSEGSDDDDAKTEPPEDPPISSHIFYPMPQPGPELDCVREKLVQYDNKWEAVKESLSTSNTAYGYPVNTMDLVISKDQPIEDLLAEVEGEFKKLLAFQVNKSSQEQLDEEYEAEIEGFAETGGLEENPAQKEYMDEGTEEGSTEEEEEEGVVETSVGSEDEESENSEEEEEEEDPSRSLNRNLGVTNYFCPVALHEHRVLKPGDPDLVATYKDKVYYFGTEESMSKFIDNPEKYVHEDSGSPLMSIPPLRIAIIGPTGSGKTLHGRQMANQFDLIHVSFRQLLQDVMMRSKLKSRIGPEYTDDVEIPAKIMPNLEDEVKNALEKLENPDTASELKSTLKDDEITLNESGSNLEDLSPHETAIRNYLENDEPLSEESLNTLLLPLWKQEPYYSKGFVLEGFPQTAEDVTYMLENNLLVDFVIDLSAEAADLVPRLLPIRFMKWKVKVEKILKNKKVVADWEAEKRKRIRAGKKKILAEKQRERRLFQTASQSRDDLENDDNEVSTEVESDNQANISEALEEELAEEEETEEEEEEETDSQAKVRLEEEITERVEKENENIKEVVEALIEAKIPHFNILADDQLTRVRYRLIRKIKNHILNREAIFERVYSVTLEEAENLIASGFKHFSLFGRYCPVSWSRVTSARLPPLNPLPALRYSHIDPKLLEYQIGDDVVSNNSGKKSKTGADPIKVCAAVYRECVYWFNSDEERKQFSSNPMAFIRAAGDMTKTLNHQPIQVAIIGDSGTEREQFSQQLAKNLRVPYLSPAKAIEWLLRSNNHSVTKLAKEIYKIIKSDSNLPDELIIEALRVAFLSPQVQGRGYILDNFPLTPEQLKLLMATPFRPMLVLDLHNDQCHHAAGEMNWLENINNEEPSDCPFLKIWLKKHNRQAEGAGAVGHEGRSASPGDNRRIRDYKRYESDSGRSGRSGTASRYKRDRERGIKIGSDKSDYDEFGNKIRGGKSDRGRQKGKSGGRDDAKDSKNRGLKRLGSADRESGTSYGKDGSKSRFRRKQRESEDSIADNGPGRRHKRGPNGKRDSSYENSQDRGQSGGKKHRKYKDDKAYSGLDSANKLGQKSSRRPGHDETKNGIVGSRRRELRRRNGSLSFQDYSDTKGGRTRRHRGRRLSSSASSDTNIRNKGKKSGRRKRNKDVSESSSSTESGQDGRPKRYRYRQRSSSSELGRGKKRREREEYSDSESTLDSDEERKRSRGRKHVRQEESDSSSDDSHEKAKHYRKRRADRSSSDSSYSESSTTSSDEDTSSQEEDSESERVEIDRNKYRFSDEISSSYDSEEDSSSDRSSKTSSKNLSILRRLGNIFESPVGAQLEKEEREWLKKFNGLLVDHYSDGNVNTSLRKALLVMTHRMAHFMEYEANKKQNKPMNVSEIGMSMEEFEKKLGEFGHFCPVKFEENDELFDCKDEQIAPLVSRLPGPKALLPNVNYTSALQSNLANYELDTTNSHLYPHIPTELRFAVEYKGKTYRMAGPDELEKFMNDPEHYIPPNAPRTLPEEKDLPKKLPKDWNLRDSKQIAFGGFCPVCYQELSQSYEGLKVGNENILALYRDDIYAFCSEECRNKFMHRPHLYAGFKLPNKLPPKKEPLELYDLPLPGYLEQTVASTLLDALAACSKFRPKYPFISPERSALIYLALQLRALNPSSPDYLRHRARQRVYEFEKSSDIIDRLAKTMPVDYIPEQQRSEAFNKQLEAFLSLRDKTGNETHQTDFLRG